MRRLILLILILTTSSLALSYEEIKNAYHQSYKYEKIQDYKNAIRAIIPVYKEYPNGYTINLRLGWLYYLDKNYANSIYHYEKAMKVLPHSVEAKLGYTLPLLAQGKFSEVEKVCYQILSTDFYNYWANLRLAYALRMQRKFDIAEKIALKLLTVYPTDVNFLVELGLIKFFTNRKKEAKQIFKDVLILDPENTIAKEYLSKIKE